MQKKLTIIDADSIIYNVAYRFKKSKASKMLEMSVNKFISDILINTKADVYLGFYGSKEPNAKPNFRFDVYEKYKGTRPETPDFVVKWRPIIHKLFKEKWGFIPVDAMEADDAVAICHEYYLDTYAITVATADKDLRQLRNITFYDFNKHKAENIDTLQAIKNISKQLLMGDTSDNIPGLPGIGKVTAQKMVDECNSAFSLIRMVISEYIEREAILKEKEGIKLTKIIKADILENEENSASEYYKLSTARIDRKIRISLASKLDVYINTIMPGGWKQYYIQQRALLLMLTKPTEDFSVPNVLDSPLADLNAVVMPVTKQENINAFLTI